MKDSGGTANGGVDSATYSFTITIAPLNSAPSITPGGDVSGIEDTPYAANWFNPASFVPGPSDESAQTLLSITTTANSNTALFTAGGQPVVDKTTGDLSFTPAPDANGSASITIAVKDSGGTANSGVDTTTYTFSITVAAVNDQPSITPGGNVNGAENAAYAASWFSPASFVPGPSNEFSQTLLSITTTANSNAALFTAGGQPAVSPTTGNLSFTPALNANGSASITITVKDSGGTANGGVDSATYSFTITIAPLNSAPSITPGADVNGTEDTPYAANWFNPASFVPGPSDESAQTLLSITTTANSNTALFTAGGQPVVDKTTGDLSFTPAPDASGSASITIAVKDSGGTTGGGVDTTTYTFSIIVAAVNDPPSITNKGMTLSEGTGANITNVELIASDPDTVAANLIYTVTQLPADGQLLKGGGPLGTNGTFTQADINSGLLRYKHNGSEPVPPAPATTDSFTFSLSDTTTVLSGQIFAIAVSKINDAPVIELSSGPTPYQMGNPPVVIDAGVKVTDSDSANFAGGQMRVRLSGGSAGDLLSIQNQGSGPGQIGFSAPQVSFGGVVIGTISGGAYPAPLVITLNSNATPAAAEALARNITFSNPSAAPKPGSRVATFKVSDDKSLSSAEASKTITINVLPVASDDTASVTINSSAQPIDVLANDSDADKDSLTVTGVTQGGHGTVAIGAGGAHVTYTPALDYLGPDSFTYQVSDGRGGSASASVQVTVRKAMILLPFITKPAYPDLAASIHVTRDSQAAGLPASIEVTVTNIGDAPASNFWVDFYINPSLVPAVNTPWNEVCAIKPCFGMAWYYTGTLAPGQSVVLNSAPASAGNPNGYRADASTWPGYFANGTKKLYAVVDSWNRNTSGTERTPYGAISEIDETNNRAEQDIVVIEGTLP